MKEAAAVQEMRIEGYMMNTHGDPRPLARNLAEKCKLFYEDEANERAYQEWKKKREEKKNA